MYIYVCVCVCVCVCMCVLQNYLLDFFPQDFACMNYKYIYTYIIQRDSKRWTQFRMFIFPELYKIYERST